MSRRLGHDEKRELAAMLEACGPFSVISEIDGLLRQNWIADGDGKQDIHYYLYRVLDRIREARNLRLKVGAE